MEFFIDRKFWNLVIKKLSPSTAVFFKNCLKKTEEWRRSRGYQL